MFQNPMIRRLTKFLTNCLADFNFTSCQNMISNKQSSIYFSNRNLFLSLIPASIERHQITLFIFVLRVIYLNSELFEGFTAKSKFPLIIIKSLQSITDNKSSKFKWISIDTNFQPLINKFPKAMKSLYESGIFCTDKEDSCVSNRNMSN